MFYKGTLKSYDAAEQVGIIHLSDKDIDLHFSLNDFPNSTLEPQIGERVKCLIEEKDFKHVAKFIVRLDHKNARTEKPRNNIFYSEEEDLEVLKKAQQEKDQALAENGTAEKTNAAIPKEFLENKQKLQEDKKLKHEKKRFSLKPSGILKNSNTNEKAEIINKSSMLNSSLAQTLTPKKSDVDLTTQPESAIMRSDAVLDEASKALEKDQLSNPIVQPSESVTISNEYLAPIDANTNTILDPQVPSDNANSSIQSVDTEMRTLSLAKNTQLNDKTEKSTVFLLKPEDEIKIPQTAPLSSFNQPVDVDIEGTLDLSHPNEIKPIHVEKKNEALITPSNDSSHLGNAKTIIPLSSDPFEQLQQELGSRHTTSIPEHSRSSGHTNVNQQLTNNATTSSKLEYSDNQNDQNKLQAVKTHLAYKTQKIKPNKRAELNFNPWILMAVISALILAAFGYFGFKKYQLHKQEQEAKARYYLLEQQKAIEDQRKRMAKLSDKPIIPADRRKELLGETAQ